MAKDAEEQHEQQEKYTSLETEDGGETRSKGKTPIMEAPLIGKKGSVRKLTGLLLMNNPAATRMKRVVGIIDFVVRLITISAALVATVTMATTAQTLPFFTQFFQFDANYDDFEAFTYFVVANGAVAVYLFLSLPFSIVTIVRPLAKGPRLFLLTLDTVGLTVTTSAASAAAAIVYLAHNGNANANWIAICSQFNDYCEKSSGAVVASFVTAVLFLLLIILSTIALKRH